MKVPKHFFLKWIFDWDTTLKHVLATQQSSCPCLHYMSCFSQNHMYQFTVLNYMSCKQAIKRWPSSGSMIFLRTTKISFKDMRLKTRVVNWSLSEIRIFDSDTTLKHVHVFVTQQSSFSLLTLCPAPATSTYVRSLYSTACPASWPSNAGEGRMLHTYTV